MTRPDFTGCRLSRKARDDLSEIWHYTAAKWSVLQADEYIDGFSLVAERIVDFPLLPRERTELRVPVRIVPYGSHLIVYRLQPPHVLIDRIIHGRRNWAALLDGDTP